MESSDRKSEHQDINSNDVNVSIEDKGTENVNIQIDTSTKTRSDQVLKVKASFSDEPNVNENAKLLNGDENAKLLNEDENAKLLNEDENAKLLNEDANAKLLNEDENAKLLNGDIEQGDGHQSKQIANGKAHYRTKLENGKKEQTSSHPKIPELLLTENNRPNDANKLILGAILVFKFIRYFIIKFIEIFHPSKRHELPPIEEPLLLLSAGEIAERIKHGQLQCEHVIRAYINRIERVQPKLNAMIDDCFEDAIQRAKEIDEQLKNPKLADDLKKLPLLGVPFTCKNSISIQGLALTAGVKIRKGAKADEDATVVKNLRSAGAIPLGLTNVSYEIDYFTFIAIDSSILFSISSHFFRLDT